MRPEPTLQDLRPVRATVDLTRLSHNFRAVADACRVPLMPVVKADAYGHGAAFVGRRLEALGAGRLAVAYPEEGVALRRAGVSVPIVVLAGFTPAQGHLLLEHRLTAVVSTPAMATAACELARKAAGVLSIHVKVDTGMGRLGFSPARMGEAVQVLLDNGGVEIEGLMTHLAGVEEDRGSAERQLDGFDRALADLVGRGVRPRWVHAVSSAGLDLVRETHTLARPGLLLYGLHPRPVSPAVDVRPIMRVSAEISLVKEVPAGTPISYGGRWISSRPSLIATLPLGYADGVPRTDAMRTHGQFSVGGQRAPVVGTVCMDLTMLDVTTCPAATEGRDAILLGDDPTAWDVASWAGTNAWEVLSRVGPRVPRVYVEEGRVVGLESRYLA